MDAADAWAHSMVAGQHRCFPYYDISLDDDGSKRGEFDIVPSFQSGNRRLGKCRYIRLLEVHPPAQFGEMNGVGGFVSYSLRRLT